MKRGVVVLTCKTDFNLHFVFLEHQDMAIKLWQMLFLNFCESLCKIG